MKTWNKKYEELPVEEQTIILLEMALEYPFREKVTPLAKLYWVNKKVSEKVLERTSIFSNEEEYNEVISEVLYELQNKPE